MSATPHTRPSTRRRAAALFAATAAAATTAVVVVLSSASAQTPAPRTLTLHELDKGSTYTHVRNTRTASQQSNSQGDLIVFTNPVTDASGMRTGKLHAQCVTTVARPRLPQVDDHLHGGLAPARRQPDGPSSSPTRPTRPRRARSPAGPAPTPTPAA